MYPNYNISYADMCCNKCHVSQRARVTTDKLAGVSAWTCHNCNTIQEAE